MLYQVFKTYFTDFQNLMFFRIYSTFPTAIFCTDVPVTPFPEVIRISFASNKRVNASIPR
ncbi:hypothetical protein D5668_13165 [Enterococcus faecalis]|nr:hypothetical protein [Enterococcus faecalis]